MIRKNNTTYVFARTCVLQILNSVGFLKGKYYWVLFNKYMTELIKEQSPEIAVGLCSITKIY